MEVTGRGHSGEFAREGRSAPFSSVQNRRTPSSSQGDGKFLTTHNTDPYGHCYCMHMHANACSRRFTQLRFHRLIQLCSLVRTDDDEMGSRGLPAARILHPRALPADLGNCCLAEQSGHCAVSACMCLLRSRGAPRSRCSGLCSCRQTIEKQLQLLPRRARRRAAILTTSS